MEDVDEDGPAIPSWTIAIYREWNNTFPMEGWLPPSEQETVLDRAGVAERVERGIWLRIFRALDRERGAWQSEQLKRKD